MSALSPAKVEKIVVSEDENEVTAIVPDYQLSLAIGKEGQNVRLAAKLCGVKIDIKSHTQYYGDPQVTVSLGGELDDEGYLNPDDFMTDEAVGEEPDGEDAAGEDESVGEEAVVEDGEAAVEEDAVVEGDAVAEDAVVEEVAAGDEAASDSAEEGENEE
jgi:N utilization substance protein A